MSFTLDFRNIHRIIYTLLYIYQFKKLNFFLLYINISTIFKTPIQQTLMSSKILKIQNDILDFSHFEKVFDSFEKKPLFEMVEGKGFNKDFNFKPLEESLYKEIHDTDEKLKTLKAEQFLSSDEKREIKKADNYLTCLDACYDEIYRCKGLNATFEHAKELFTQIMEKVGEIAKLYNSEENKSSYNCAGLELICAWKLINKLVAILDLAMAERAIAFLHQYDPAMRGRNLIISTARLLTFDSANTQCKGLKASTDIYINTVATMINRAHFVIAGLSNMVRKFLEEHHSSEFFVDQY
jgi:hypothetical protein